MENNKLGCIGYLVAYANGIAGPIVCAGDIGRWTTKRVKKRTLLSHFVPFSDDMNYILFARAATSTSAAI